MAKRPNRRPRIVLSICVAIHVVGSGNVSRGLAGPGGQVLPAADAV
jgi:hypothetical protein